MTTEVFKLMRCFPGSFLNFNGECILSLKGNIYINIMDCVGKFDIEMKLLQWCSRPISKGEFYVRPKQNTRYREYLLNCLNKYMKTNFNIEDMELIYDKLGNGINPRLTNIFITNGYDMNLLKES